MKCCAFWYHMYGDSTGSLTLHAQAGPPSGPRTMIWSESGDQGNSWHQATVDLSAYAGQPEVRLRFSGLTGNSFRSDISIDDVTVNGQSGSATSSSSSMIYSEDFEQPVGPEWSSNSSTTYGRNVRTISYSAAGSYGWGMDVGGAGSV